MNFKKYIFILFIVLIYNQDTRFIDEVFDEIVITEDIVYGNAPDLPFIFLFEWNTNDIDLHMDIYEPLGDTMQDRPVIIFAHSGAFFIGSKDAQDMVELCKESARRGYVAISMEYRLGLNILSSYSGERAVYRGVQDGSAIIRYLKEFHNSYNINPEKIFFWGSSAGSFIGLHLAYIEDSERPLSTYGNDFDPDLGCIDCEGNDFIHSNKPRAVISTWGAIANLDYIDSYENIPVALFHGTSDLIVPYDEGYPFTLNITLPFVYGSSKISEKMSSLNINHNLVLEENEPHEYYGAFNGNFDLGGGPNAYWDSILQNSYQFLFSYLDTNGDVNNDGILNIQDIIIIINFILNIEIPTDQQFEIADMNSDGILNILDIIQIVYEITL
jgi:predicted esterase